MLRRIGNWLGEKTGVGANDYSPVPGAKGHSPVQSAGAPTFEPLEPRLLLNADLSTLQPLLTLNVPLPDQEIHVDLEQRDRDIQADSSAVLIIDLASTERTDQQISTSAPAGAPASGAECGVLIEKTPSDSPIMREDDSAGLIVSAQQDSVPVSETLVTEIRGPPTLPGLRLVDPDISNWQGQIIYLDCDGAKGVTYHGPVTVGPFDVPAFQAPDELADQEQAIIVAVLTRLERTFANSGVIFTTVQPSADTEHSTIYIGGAASAFAPYGSFLGLAEQVDTGNQTRSDQGLVFSERFTGTSADGYASSLAGVVAHEVGHLLGYEHSGWRRTDLIAANRHGVNSDLLDVADSDGKIDLDYRPNGVTVSPNGQYLAVTHYDAASKLTIVRLADEHRTVVDVGSYPAFAVFSLDSSKVFVSTFHGSNVAVVDASTGSVIRTISGMFSYGGPYALAMHPSGNSLYVTDGGDDGGKVVRIDTHDYHTTNIPVGSGIGSSPYGVTFNVQRDRAYVSLFGDSSIAIIQTATNTVVDYICPADFGGGRPYDLAVTPDGNRLYVTDIDTQKVWIIDTHTHTKVGEISIGVANPWFLSMSPDGERVFVSSYGSNSLNARVSIIDTGTNQVVREIAINARETATSADGRTLYIANYDDREISVFQLNGTPTVQDASFSVAEDATTGTSVGMVSGFDPDAGDSLTYSVTAGNELGVFAIDGSSGEITVSDDSNLDYEATPSFSLVVQVEDSGALTDTATITITVTDVNEAPTIALVNTTTSLPEDADTTSRSRMADIVVTDDALGVNVLSLSGADAELFEIEGTTLYLRAGAMLSAGNPRLDVTVVVEDAAVGASPDDAVSLLVTIRDTTPPAPVSGLRVDEDTGISSEDGLTQNTSVVLWWFEPFDAGGIAGYEYRLGDGEWLGGSVSTEVELQLSEGGHTFAVRAVDNAGNRGPMAETIIVVDLTAPSAVGGLDMVDDTAIDTEDGLTADSTPTFSWETATDSSGIWKYEYSLDGGAWVAVFGMSRTLSVAEGTHGFSVRAVDNAGNTGDPTVAVFTVDRTPPSGATGLVMADDNGVSATDGLTSDNTPTFSWQPATDAHGVWKHEYSMDGDIWADVFGTSVELVLSEGTHTFRVCAVDNAGNQGETTELSVVIDLTPPSLIAGLVMADDTGCDREDGRTADSTPIFSWEAASDEHGIWKYEYGVDGGAWRDAFGTSVELTPAEGSHTFSVRAVDTGGNRTAAAERAFVIDWTPPRVTVNAQRTNDSRPQLSGSVDDVSASIEVTVNGGRYPVANNGDGTWILSAGVLGPPLAEGIYDIVVSATDRAGNAGVDRTSNELTIDATAPTFRVPLEGKLIAGGAQVLSVAPSELLACAPEVSATDSAGQTIAISSPSRRGMAYEYVLTPNEATAQGRATFSVTGEDVAGNPGIYSGVFYIDSIAPGFDATIPSHMGLGTSHILVTAYDPLPAIPQVSICFASGKAVEVLSPSFDGSQFDFPVRVRRNTANGEATVTIAVCDVVGNVRAEVQTVIIDAVSPTLTVSVTPDPPAAAQRVVIHLVADEELAALPELLATLDGHTPLPVVLTSQADNTYTWICSSGDVAVISVSASDAAGNQMTKTLTFADVSVPAGTLNLSGIPYLGNGLTVEATITNSGKTRVEDVPVRFYYGSFWDREPLGTDQAVTLAPGESKVLSVFWPATKQEDNAPVYVVADPDNVLAETDELNNAATRGPVVVAQGLDHQTYLLTDTIAEVWAIPFDSSNDRRLDDSEATVSVWVEDDDGHVVAGPWAAAYDLDDERFEMTFNPSLLGAPGKYYLGAGAISTGLNFAPMSSRGAFQVIRDFRVTLGSDHAAYERGEHVLLLGTVVDTAGDPVAGAEVSLTMTAQYGTRFFTVSTNEAGGYGFMYYPGAQEAGAYEVVARASRGEISRESGAAAFEIEGLYLHASRTSTRILAGDEQTIAYRVWNLGTTALSDVRVTVNDLGGVPELNVVPDLAGMPGGTLTPGQMAVFSLHVRAGQTLGTRDLGVRVTAGDESVEESRLRVEVFGTNPCLLFDPGGLEIIVPNGGSLSREVVVRNVGWRDAQDVVLTSDVPDWVTLVGNSIIDVLPGNKGLSDEGFGLFTKYSLLGRIGADGDVFEVGSDALFRASTSGELQFRINEREIDISDNKGGLGLDLHLESSDAPQHFTVRANAGWQATGIFVQEGLEIHAMATGLWQTGAAATRDPDGNGAARYVLSWRPDDPELVTGTPYDGVLKAGGANADRRLMWVRTWVTSDLTGSVAVTVADAMGQPLAGVQVTLYSQVFDPETRTYPVFTGLSGPDGHLIFSDLTPGPYGYRLSLNEYEVATGTCEVTAGAETPIRIVLRPNVVTVEWIVEDVQITDIYTVALRVRYEAASAQLVIAPIARSACPGVSVLAGAIRIRNAGMLAAENVVFTLPELKREDGTSSDCTILFSRPDGSREHQRVISTIQPGEDTELEYEITIGSDAAFPSVLSAHMRVDYEFTDDLGQHSLTLRVPVSIQLVDLSSTGETDHLVIDPPVIVAMEYGEKSYLDVISYAIDREYPVRVINGGENVCVARSVGIVLGLGGKGIGWSAEDVVTDILDNAVIDAIEESLSMIPDVGIILGSFEPRYRLRGNEFFSIGGLYSEDVAGLKLYDLTVPSLSDLLPLPSLDLASVSVSGGLLCVRGDWYAESDNNFDTPLYPRPTFKFAPIILVQLGGCLGDPYTWYIPILDLSDEAGRPISIGPWVPSHGLRPVPPPPQMSETAPVPQYVTFDIGTDVAIERQAFVGTLNIHNGSQTTPLTNLSVRIETLDEQGNLICADHRYSEEFFFRVDGLNGVSGIDGDGSLAPGGNGTIEFLIVPTHEAGGNDYQLRAVVEWTWGGVPDGITSKPQSIEVRLLPFVHLDYFIEEEFSAGEAFSFGVMATNVGEGPVDDLSITASPPAIVWDQTDVDRARVEIDEALAYTPSGTGYLHGLTLELGKIDPGQSGTGWWTLHAWPGGRVVDFSVQSIGRRGDLGGERTSLLDTSIGTHVIAHAGLIDYRQGGLGGDLALVDWDRDGQPDKLLDLPAGETYDVAVVASTVTQWPNFQSSEMRLELEKTDGWIYTEVTGPYNDLRGISEIRTADGRVLDPRNYWFADGKLHIVDDPAAEYIIVFEEEPRTITTDGLLILDAVQYVGLDSIATVLLTEGDLNKTLGPGNDVAVVRVSSAADPEGEAIVLTETQEPGLFRGTFGFETSVAGEDQRVVVGDGQLLTVSYLDEAGADGSAREVTARAQWVSFTVDAGPNQTADEGDVVSFNGSFSGAESGGTYTIAWEFGDGGTASGTLTPMHTYADNGTYTATLTVTDDNGDVDSDELIITVNNVAPEMHAGADQRVGEGEMVNLGGLFTDPGADTWIATVDYGDGTGVQPLALMGMTFALDHTYLDDGTYTVTVGVTDDDGGVGQDTLTVAVNDLHPTASLTGSTALDEGQSGSFDASGSTSYPDTITSYEWDWNYDGVTFATSGGIGTTQSHTWMDDGTYSVAVRVTDDDGSSGVATRTVTVNDLGPVAALTGDPALSEGQTGSFDASGSRSWPDSISSYEWDWAYDGSFDPSGDVGPTQSHAWAVDGTYRVAVRITDEDGSLDVATLTTKVEQPAAPTAVDSQVSVSLGLMSYDRRTLQTKMQMTITNTSQTPIYGPVWIVIKAISDSSVKLVGSSGTTSDGYQYLNVTSLLGDGRLDPGEKISTWLSFNNPLRRQFNFSYSVRGLLSPLVGG